VENIYSNNIIDFLAQLVINGNEEAISILQWLSELRFDKFILYLSAANMDEDDEKIRVKQILMHKLS
jgi:hypothetical protein